MLTNIKGKKLKKIGLFYLFIFIAGCSTNTQPVGKVQAEQKEIVIEKKLEIKKRLIKVIPKKEKLIYISQNAEDYTGQLKDISIDANLNKYENNYFKPWNINNALNIKDDVDWAFKIYNETNSYGENLQPINKSFFQKMKINANFKNYSSLNKRAINIKEVNLRAFPTNKPLLMNPSKAGEGFPFDYLQNSTLHSNKPLFATHYSKDKEWVHVVSSFTYGWVKTKEITFLQKKETNLWQKAQQVFILKDDVPLYSKKGKFLFKSKIGMMFALINESNDSYTILTVDAYNVSLPHFISVKISKNIATKDVLDFNSKNINTIITELLKSNYGWGGMYGQRDCSSTLRDFYAPFGLWLPRNSVQQSKLGKVITLDLLTNEEKIKIIKEKAKPFKTLLYKPGHIVLYAGVVNDEIIVFQNIWGIKTKKEEKEGRFIVGKAVFSKINFGENLHTYDVNASLLKNLKSLNILY